MNTHPITHFLLTCLLTVSLCVDAQVYMTYEDPLIGQISKTTAAQVNVSNFTGVEIHYYFKGWITDEDGRELLRVKSQLLKHRPGGALYSREGAEEDYRMLNVDPWEKLEIFSEVKGWEQHTGQLTLHAQLIHPLDTFSVIAAVEQTVYLKNGTFVNTDGQYITDPQLVRLLFEREYDDDFLLEQLPDALSLENNNPYPYCGDYYLRIQQGGEDIFVAKLKADCIPAGKQTLSWQDLEVELDRYADRNLEQELEVVIQATASDVNGHRITRVQAVRHAQYDGSQRTYSSRIFGLSFDFFNYAEQWAFPAKAAPVLIFDEGGRISDVEQLPIIPLQYPWPMDFPRGFYLSRDDVNGGVGLLAYDWTDLSEEEWRSFLAYQWACSTDAIRQQSVDDVTFWYPKQLHNIKRDNKMPWPYDIFSVAIQDGERFLILTSTIALPPTQIIPNYEYPDFEIDPQAIFSTVNYHGLALELKVDQSGNLQQIVAEGAGRNLASSADRQAAYDRFARYASIVKAVQPSSWAAPELERPSLEALDQQIAASSDVQALAMPHIQKITPNADPVRKYRDYNWEEAALTFSHRIAAGEEGQQYEPFVGELSLRYQLDEQDSILSRYFTMLSKSIDTENWAGEIAYSAKRLSLSTIRGQQIQIDWADPKALSDREVEIVLLDEFVFPFAEAPKLYRQDLKDWTFWTTKRMLNKSKKGTPNSVVFVRTDAALFRINLTGGFTSDVPFFLNSLVLEGHQLSFDFDEDKVLREIRME